MGMSDKFIIHNPLGFSRLARATWQTIRTRMLDDLRAQGYSDIGPPQFDLLLYLSQGPMTPSQLTVATGISKQGINYLLQSLENGGYAMRRPDSSNRRQRLVHLTTVGEQATNVIRDTSHRFEREVRERVGVTALEEYREVMRIISVDIGGVHYVPPSPLAPRQPDADGEGVHPAI
jgi:DNA-binding MarR family transcriptional regulator